MAFVYTLEAAKAARDSIIEAVEATEPVIWPGIDSQALALGLGRLVNGLSPRQHARLAAFDGQEGFTASMLDELRAAGPALWLTITERNVARDGVAPVVDLKTLASEGRDRRRALTETLQYNLRGDAAAEAELKSIRKGRGYRDLAEDLQRLVMLARTHAAILAGDRHHDPASLDAADILAGRILAQVNPPDASQAERLTVLQHRHQGYIAIRYRVLRALAGFVFRDEPIGEQFGGLSTLVVLGQLT